MANEKLKRRLEETGAIIKKMNEQLREFERERFELMKEIYGSTHNVIDEMPARVRNALKLIGINTDLMFKRFLDGNFCKEDLPSPSTAKFHMDYYENNSNTREERLMSIRGIGENIAYESVRVADEKGL